MVIGWSRWSGNWLARLLTQSVLLPVYEPSERMVIGGLSGYAYGLNNAFNGIHRAHVLFLSSTAS